MGVFSVFNSCANYYSVTYYLDSDLIVIEADWVFGGCVVMVNIGLYIFAKKIIRFDNYINIYSLETKFKGLFRD